MQQRSGQSTLDWHTQANGFLHCQERKILLSACYYEISDSDNAEGAGKSGELLWGAIAEGVKDLHMIQILWL